MNLFYRDFVAFYLKRFGSLFFYGEIILFKCMNICHQLLKQNELNIKNYFSLKINEVCL